MADAIKPLKVPARNDLTAEYLRDILLYNPEDGSFIWKENRLCVKPGAVAGHKQQDGYVTIRIDHVSFYAHRLAWLYVHGRWPKRYIDHQDGDTSNNRISNLREATQAQNMANAPKQSNNKSGVRGVCFDKSRNQWLAFLSRRILGRFDTFEGALSARRNAEKSLHHEFRRA